MPTWGWIIIGLFAVIAAFLAGFGCHAVLSSTDTARAAAEVNRLQGIIDDMRTACKGGAA